MPENSNGFIKKPEISQQQAIARRVPLVLKLTRLAFHLGGQVAPSLAGRIAFRLWFTPTRFKTPLSELEAYESAEIKSIQIDGHDIVTYSWGQKGATVLLVHGWSGRGTQLGSFIAPLIKMGYQVFSFDMPAHGKSSGKQTNLYKVAETIVAIQQHYGVFESVITHSFGGPCVTLAMQKGFATNSLVSISPPGHVLGLVEKYISVLRIPEKAGKHMVRHIETLFGKNIWDEISMVNTVKNIKIPGLLIHDTDDVDVPWQEGEDVAKAWAKAEFIKTSGLGHRRILRDQMVVEKTVNFIKDNQVNR